MTIQPVESEASEVQALTEAAAQAEGAILNDHAAMLKEIRSWGLWSLGLGAMHLVTAGFLSAPWGILLLLVGLGSFYFRSASMFIIYAVTLAWAALSNLTSFQVGWAAFALLQLFLAYRVFQQYRRFHSVEGEIQRLVAAEPDQGVPLPGRAARFFPWLGSLLSCSSLLGFVVFFASHIIIAALGSDPTNAPAWMEFSGNLLMNLGVLGFAAALASLLSRYQPKAISILGLVAGGIMLLIQVALYFL